MQREELFLELEMYGISGKCLYLAETLPLLEMIWADGQNQEKELEIFRNILTENFTNVNEHAGFPVFSKEEVEIFIKPFLSTPPPQRLLELIMELYMFQLEKMEHRKRDLITKTLLGHCIDIASSSVTAYPFNNNERFNLSEKQSFFKVINCICS